VYHNELKRKVRYIWNKYTTFKMIDGWKVQYNKFFEIDPRKHIEYRIALIVIKRLLRRGKWIYMSN
jgi:hypothetical protein